MIEQAVVASEEEMARIPVGLDVLVPDLEFADEWVGVVVLTDPMVPPGVLELRDAEGRIRRRLFL